MRDIHCHILPGVDDGAANLEQSLAMLEAARAVGVTHMVCTPHCRDPYFDFEKMWEAYRLLCAHAGDMHLQMGFEVNHAKLMDLGIEWADRLHLMAQTSFCLSSRRVLIRMTLRNTRTRSTTCSVVVTR